MQYMYVSAVNKHLGMWAVKVRVTSLRSAGKAKLIAQGHYFPLDHQQQQEPAALPVALVLQCSMRGRMRLPLGWCPATAQDPNCVPVVLDEDPILPGSWPSKGVQQVRRSRCQQACMYLLLASGTWMQVQCLVAGCCWQQCAAGYVHGDVWG